MSRTRVAQIPYLISHRYLFLIRTREISYARNKLMREEVGTISYHYAIRGT